jgi:hypothetical protein
LMNTSRSQRRGRNDSSTIEVVFSAWSVPTNYLEDNWRYRQLRIQLWNVNQWATEAEETPLLRFVTRKRLVKTLQRHSHCGSESKLKRLNVE